MFSSVDSPDDRENCFQMMNCGWRHVQTMWPCCLSAIGLPGQSDLLDAYGFAVAFLWAMGPKDCLFLITPSFRLGKVHIPWFVFCIDKFLRSCVHQSAKVCILQPHLRTRRCVGLWISSHPALRFPRSHEYPRTFGCKRTSRGWGTCRNMRRQVRRCGFQFCHTSYLICSWILFAIVLEQLIKQEFLAQQI